MDPGNVADRSDPIATEADTEAVDFVRFCYRRRRVGWPELYDEMCAVAGRGLYRGYGADDLAGIGIGLTLFEMPALAALVQRIASEDQARRRLIAQEARATIVAAVATEPAASEPVAADRSAPERIVSERPAAEEMKPQARLVVVAAGA